MHKEFEQLMKKITNEVKSMNLPKEVLLSLNFKDLFEALCQKYDNKQITYGDNFYLFIYHVIKTCTNLDAEKSSNLWYCHEENDYEQMSKNIDYIAEFNYQMAKYFDKTII